MAFRYSEEVVVRVLRLLPMGYGASASGRSVDGVRRCRTDLPERTDVLVVGSRGYRMMRRVLLGGVAGVLVRTARVRWWSCRDTAERPPKEG
jgi:hypothetical protein